MIKKVFTLKIFYALLCTILIPTYISDKSIGFSGSIVSVLFFAAISAILFWQHEKQDKRLFVFSHILGFLFSCFFGVGKALDNAGGLPLVLLSFSIILFTHIWALIISIFWVCLIKFEKWVEEKSLNERGFVVGKYVEKFFRHPYVIFLALIVCWIPFFIAEFPGGFRYDATNELLQIERGFRTDFPMLHSVIITRLIPFFYDLTGSYNIGVFVYVITQMGVIALIYTHILSVFSRLKINKMLLFFAFIYCAFFPVIQILVVQMVRDVMFSALFIYTIFNFYLMNIDREHFWKSRNRPLLLATLLVLTICSRNNDSLLIGVGFISLTTYIIWWKYHGYSRRGVGVFAVFCLVLYVSLSLVLLSLCQPLMPSRPATCLSLVAQCIARVYTLEKENLSEQEKADFSRYMRVDKLNYHPKHADSAKFSLHMEKNIKTAIGFVKFWIKTGMKYPKYYIQAILYNNQDMWFPGGIIYKGLGGYEKDYFWIGTNESPVDYKNLMPWLLEFYKDLCYKISFERIPIVSQLFSIGFHFWFALNCLFYVIYRKKYCLVLPVSIILGYMVLSCFVLPVVIVRYYSPVFMVFPIIFVFTIQPSFSSKYSINS